MHKSKILRFENLKRRQSTLGYTSGVLGIFYFPPVVQTTFFGQKNEPGYCRHSITIALITRNESKYCSAGRYRSKFPIYCSTTRSQERGKCDLFGKTQAILDLNHSYCPILAATLSTLSKERGNWLELIVTAELRAEIVKAERIASLLKSASW